MADRQEQVVFGVFKGMGDLLWATSVVRAELERGSTVHLMIFANPLLIELCSLIDLGPRRSDLHFHVVPVGWRDIPRFMAELRILEPAFVLISPHAPAADSSWRVPLAMRLLQKLFWPKSVLIGADTERLSRLFDRRLHVDRTLPLSVREWTTYCRFRDDPGLPSSQRPHFVPEIENLRSQPPVYDLLIHPGAGAENRIWSADKYPALLAALPASWRIAVLALPAELAKLRLLLPADRPVECIPITDSLQRSLEFIASSRLLFVMNSGTMHFADVLGIPTVALFGQQSPAHVIDGGSIDPVYVRSVPCQPCGRNTCDQPEVYCLTHLDPASVAQRLQFQYNRLSGLQSAHGFSVFA